MKRLLISATIIAISIGLDSLPANAADAWTTCNVGQVRAMRTHLAVYCAAPYTGKTAAFNKDVPYYAIPYTMQENRFSAILDVLIAARVNGRKARIRYDLDHKKNPAGCRGSDCRALTAAVLR